MNVNGFRPSRYTDVPSSVDELYSGSRRFCRVLTPCRSNDSQIRPPGKSGNKIAEMVCDEVEEKIHEVAWDYGNDIVLKLFFAVYAFMIYIYIYCTILRDYLLTRVLNLYSFF